MRSILFFDLPMVTDKNVRTYTKFRKELIKLGYTMIQNSVYVKVLNGKVVSNTHLKKLKQITPSNGNVRVLILTEKQFEDMKILSGSRTHNEELNDINRFKVI